VSPGNGVAHPDPRLAAASHWGPRVVASGVDLGIFEATVARVERWDQWCAEWRRNAQRFEEVAVAAESAGRHLTAGQAWIRAALCAHWGKFLFMDDLEQQRAASDQTVACFAKGMWTLVPPAERVEIPYPAGGVRLAGLLRRPPGIDRPPIVIMVPGLDSVKEELQSTADYFLRRGMATLAVDGPGQGETEHHLAIEPAYERPVAAMVDWVVAHGDVDTSRIGFYGVSLGGYYAVRAAAYESRLSAAVGLAGPYTFGDTWDGLPGLLRAAFRVRSRSDSDEQARHRALELSLAGVDGVLCPTLVVHGRKDTIIPYSEGERMGASIDGLSLVTYDDGSHGISNHFFESRSLMADWLAEHLRGGSPGSAAG
jgi:dipeptidyl aminopeptidase/acylaminoacyl peptidase